MKTLLVSALFAFLSVASAELPENYQSQSAFQKRELLWQQISAKPYSTLPSLDSAASPSLKELFFSGIGDAFTSPTDEIVAGRKKVIHKWGSAVKFRFEADRASQYTGIFSTGAIGIARASLALPFASGKPFVPGLALKFFVDGQPSKNLTVMERLEGQGEDTNYFKSAFTNVIPNPEEFGTKLGTWIFEGFVKDALHLKAEHLATVTAEGVSVAATKAPFQLLFIPTREAAISSSSPDFREELAKIPVGTVLYDVYAKENEAKGSALHKVGRIITESRFVASAYEDETLYFQHSGTALRTGYVIRWFHPFRL